MTYTLWTREGSEARRYTHGNSVWCWTEMRWSPGEKTESFPGKHSIGMQSLCRLWKHWGTQKPSALLAVSALPAWTRQASRLGQLPLWVLPADRRQERFSRLRWPIASHWKGNSRNVVWLPGGKGEMHRWVAGGIRGLCSLGTVTCQVPE